MKTLSDRKPLALLALIAVGLVAAAGGVAYAAFSSSTTNPASSFAAMRVFPGERSTTAWRVDDAADGTTANTSFPVAFSADALTADTSGWTTSFAANRFVDLQLNGPLPSGVAVSQARLTFTFADPAGGNAASAAVCFYFDVLKTSDGSLLGTHGSSGTPIACEATNVLQTVSIALSELATSDVANDLTVRVYGRHATNGTGMRIDRATVTGATHAPFTLYPALFVDQADTTPATIRWGPVAAADGTHFETGLFATTYAGTRWVDFTFPSYPPGAATVNGVNLDVDFRSQVNGFASCFYLQVFNGATLIGTHGGTGSDLACNSSGTTWVSHSEALAEVDTVAEVNNLRIRIFGKNAGSDAIQFDRVRLRVDWGLGAGSGCADGSSATHLATADTYTAQNQATTNFGTNADVRVRSSNNANRRTYVAFSQIPTLVGAGCSVTSATLRLWQSTSAGARTLQVFRASSAWGETTVTWNTQPATAGTAATFTNASGWRDVDVTQHVNDMIANGNWGFVVRDATENAGAAVEQIFHSREGANDPQLLVTIG